MIISASRRTDIPAFYADWMIQRLREGEVLVRNPMNPSMLGRVRLSSRQVDMIAFWTKNPRPMFQHLDALDDMGYRHYFMMSLTPYGRDVEANLPPKEALVEDFLRLSERLGRQRVDWRYDPVMLTQRHTIAWHEARFAEFARRIAPNTTRCILSFADPYRHLKGYVKPMDPSEMRALAKVLADIAAEYGLALYTCAEQIDLSELGIRHAACIDGHKIEGLLNAKIRTKRAGDRPHCGCIHSVDIGAYDTCAHGCAYCYAVKNAARALQNARAQDQGARILGAPVRGDEAVYDWIGDSLIDGQLMF